MEQLPRGLALYRLHNKQVSADANETRLTVPASQSTIVLYTGLYAKCDQQSAIVVDCT